MSNFPCPDCGITIRHAARSCACGWGKSGRRAVSTTEPINAEQFAARMEREAEFSAACRQRLNDNHVTTADMTQPERMKAMAAYRDMLKTTMRTADVDPKAWAHSLKSDYIDGVVLQPIQIHMASGALNEVWSNRECKPITPATAAF